MYECWRGRAARWVRRVGDLMAAGGGTLFVPAGGLVAGDPELLHQLIERRAADTEFRGG